MRHRPLFLIILFCLAATLSAQKQPEKKSKTQNLVKNGAFENGEGKTPKHWSPFDGFTARWEKDSGNPGRCLLLDTTVLTIDKKLIDADIEAFEKRGRSNAAGQYDTVGAHQGAWAYAAPIDIKPDDSWFILSAAVWADQPSTALFAPLGLIRGFRKITADTAGEATTWFHEHYKDGIGYSDVFGSKDLQRASREGDYLQVYRKTLFCRNPRIKQWRHFEVGFKLPSIKKFRPERILIKPYAFWPSGNYRFDNIVFRRATKEEAEAANKNLPSIKEVLQ